MKELTKIVDIQLARLQRQLSDAGLTILISDSARAELANEGFDPTYGARPLSALFNNVSPTPWPFPSWTAAPTRLDRLHRLERRGIYVQSGGLSVRQSGERY